MDETKKQYINRATLNEAIAAFYTKDKKLKTGMIVTRNEEEQYVDLKTKYDKYFFKVPYEDIVWVKNKSNNRWPKPVYLLFEKNGKGESNQDG